MSVKGPTATWPLVDEAEIVDQHRRITAAHQGCTAWVGYEGYDGWSSVTLRLDLSISRGRPSTSVAVEGPARAVDCTP